MEHGVCKLCETKKELCESHIIPEFFYEPIYEPNNPSHVYYEYSSAAPRRKAKRKGIWQHLFCKGCEQRFGKLENYIKPLWFSDEIQFRREGNVSYFLKTNYTMVKLFQLSVIWRASICTAPAFNNVQLGIKHESIIKEMLLREDPGRYYDYGCMLVHANDNELQDIYNGTLCSLPSVKMDGHRIYPMVFGAFAWLFCVSSHLKESEFSHLFLKENGELPIFSDPKIAKPILLKIAHATNRHASFANKEKV